MTRKTERRRRFRVRSEVRQEIAQLYGEKFASSELVIDAYHPAAEFYRPVTGEGGTGRTLFEDEVEPVDDEDDSEPDPDDPVMLAGLTVTVPPTRPGNGAGDDPTDAFPWQRFPGVAVSLAGERAEAMPVPIRWPQTGEVVIRLGLHDLVHHGRADGGVEISLVVHDGLDAGRRRAAEAYLADVALEAFARLPEHGPVDVRRCCRGRARERAAGTEARHG